MSLPTGTVTLLFTDIEGSTRLVRERGSAWPALLAEHHRLLREAFGAMAAPRSASRATGSSSPSTTPAARSPARWRPSTRWQR